MMKAPTFASFGAIDPGRPERVPPAFDDVVRGRRTVRAFLPQRVPRAVVSEILDLAARSPSTFNTQPWQVHVVAGPARQALVDAILEDHAANAVPPFTPFPNPPPSDCAARQAEFARHYYASLSILQDDMVARARQTSRNYQFFDAPVGLMFTIDTRLTHNSWLDLGLFLQTLMLAAHARGLGTCPQVAFLRYERRIATQLRFDAYQALVCGMSLGYPDGDAGVNQVCMPRDAAGDFTTWHGFDGSPG
ncbi:nitroreductase [Variovorax humicola]|uniref:Nitroreductase n=1 Tax=Variovorax humicola TaxID=1769758 RepID=A0ABU8W0W7_9BURK